MTNLDFDRIRRDYPLPDIATASGLDLKKNGNEFQACCPFHGEKSPSFSIYRDKHSAWKYHCFGCGAHGDSIDFVKERYGTETNEAVRIITGDEQRSPKPTADYKQATDPYAGYEITRPPSSTPQILAGQRTPPLLNPKRVDATSGDPKVITYKPSMVFPYTTKTGELLGYVLRVEFDDKKITPGIWWMENKSKGFYGWSHGSYPSPRPLYGLKELHEHPEAQVLLVEGEKCKDAAARLMAGKKIVAASWMGGGKALSKTYWKSLAGRSIVIWPDNDEEGWKTTLGYPTGATWHKGLVEYCYEAGAKLVKIVHITPTSRNPGWDIADAEKEGLGQKGVELIIRDRIETWTRERHAEWKQRATDKANGVQHVYPDEGRIQIVEEPQPKVSPKPRVNGTAVSGAGKGEPKPKAAGNGSNGASHRPANGVARPEAGEGDALEHRGEVYRDRQGDGITAENWQQHIIQTEKGGPKASSLQNASLVLQYESRFAGVFAWNDFAKEVYLQRRPPWEAGSGSFHVRKITDPDVTATTCHLEYTGMTPKSNDVAKLIQRVSQHYTYNPVTERLNRLEWDGVPRLSGNGNGEEGEAIAPWLTKYLGAVPSTENIAFGRKWMIGAVARAFDPGCKMDTMLVLEGPQGLKKSTALRILSDAAAPHVFTDEISDPNSKDAAMQMQGAFIIEIAELDAFRRAEITQIKAWLTRQVDRFRRPYGKIVEDFPRACVFAGTVNPIGIGYLKDPSGGRRFWPVECGKIDLDQLSKDAPQLWAEAVAAYQDKEKWWLDDDEQIYANVAQAARYEEDPYNTMIDEFVATRTTVTLLEIMQHALEIPKERRSAIVNKRIAGHLHSRGWKREQHDDGRIYYSNPRRMI